VDSFMKASNQPYVDYAETVRATRTAAALETIAGHLQGIPAGRRWFGFRADSRFNWACATARTACRKATPTRVLPVGKVEQLTTIPLSFTEGALRQIQDQGLVLGARVKTPPGQPGSAWFPGRWFRDGGNPARAVVGECARS